MCSINYEQFFMLFIIIYYYYIDIFIDISVLLIVRNIHKLD
jgi:hypothetical protein